MDYETYRLAFYICASFEMGICFLNVFAYCLMQFEGLRLIEVEDDHED